MNDHVRDELLARIGAYRDHLRSSLGMPDNRVALLQLLRTIDYQFLTEALQQKVGRKDDDQQLENIQQLFKWGLNEALNLTWNEQALLPGVPLVRTFPMLRDWAASILQCSGRLRLVEHGMEMARVKLATVVRDQGNDNVFIFEYAENSIGIESIEREDFSFFADLVKKLHDKDGVWKAIASKRPEVAKIMRSLVEPWKQHYIKYGADPIVDEYYHDLASAIAPTKPGWDAFPHEATFGGIKFLTYINCVRILIGFALKHFDFCLILHNRHPDIDIINILSVPSEWTASCQYMANALGISVDESKQVMLATVVSHENLQEVTKIPASAYAPHYQIANGSIIRLITGCLDQPFLFMLRELRRRYPGDWDRSVDSRQDVFRSELAAFLTKYPYVAVFSDNINITCSKGKTDIDVLVIDFRAKIAGIFQLKWQDYFGASIRERESRKSNLLKNGNAWIERVCCWLDEGGLPTTLRSLGVPKSVCAAIKDVRLFVLGRNFSHFSGSFELDKRAAWGNWIQLVRLMHDPGEGESVLSILHEKLVADSPINRATPPKETLEIKIGDWRWVMQPSKNWGERSTASP